MQDLQWGLKNLPFSGVSLIHYPMDQNNRRVFVSSIFICLVRLITWSLVTPQAKGRAFFVFGDSLVDNGNNNYLATTARADSYPYGIDYPTHRPTGRFSNGLNIPDLISWVQTPYSLIYFSSFLLQIFVL